MINLKRAWPAIKKRLMSADVVLILLDYDGTLSPISPRPRDAVLEKGLKKILVSLSKKSSTALGIISGRSLREVKKQVQVKNIYYAGNHGLQMSGRGLSFTHAQSRRLKPRIQKIKRTLKKKLKGIPGIILEDKGFTLTLHYRLTPKKYLGAVEKTLKLVTTPYIKQKSVKVSTGKKCWEIKPRVDWNKGKAANKIFSIFKAKRVVPIYVGDDVTDEDVFRAFKNKGITVFVGSPKARSAAKYNLSSVTKVKSFLKKLDNLL